jgi:SAM-dependent methyltransferase
MSNVPGRDIRRRLKRLFAKTPLNKAYITESSIRSNIESSIGYVKGIFLDLGCGETQYKPLFVDRVERYIGIDVPSSLYEVSNADIFASGDALPFRSGMFDTVLCTQVLEHVKEPSVVVAEISRVLKSGGHLILTAPFSEPKHDEPYDFYRYTDHGLRYLSEKNGLAVISVRNHHGNLAMIGQHLASFANDKFLANKVTHQPRLLLAPFVIPLCAFLQLMFLFLDKLFRLETHPVGFTLVAKK